MDINATFEAPPRTISPPPTPPVTRHTKLEDMDIQHELLRQYNTALTLYEAAEINDSIPLNQKAQAINTIQGILSAISKTQTELYNSERVKTLELTLIDTLKEFPEMSKAFLAAYEKNLKRVNK